MQHTTDLPAAHYLSIRAKMSATDMWMDNLLPEACDRGDGWGAWMLEPGTPVCAICDSLHDGMIIV
jgi:hypothetical protein